MKLQIIAENLQGVSPEEVLAAVVAAVQHKGRYFPASSTSPTKESAIRAIWNTDVQGFEADTKAIQTLMKNQSIINKAQDIILWIRQKKITPNDPDFLKTAQDIATKSLISNRMVGYIAGLYPFYDRETQGGAISQSTPGSTAAPAAQKRPIYDQTWDPSWGEVKILWDTPAKVVDVRQLSGSDGSRFLQVLLGIASGHAFAWYIGMNGTAPKIGAELKVTGFLEPSDRRVGTIRFVPDDIWKRRIKKSMNVGDEDDGKDDKDD